MTESQTREATLQAPRDTRQLILAGLIITAVVIALIAVMYFAYPEAVDWFETYHPAAQNWQDPYGVTPYINPPWALALLPHAFLPPQLGSAINFLLNIAVMIAVIRKLGGDRLTYFLVFTSPFFFDLARTNNIDWIPLLAFLVPKQWGLIFLAVKPQIFGGVALVWWKERNHSLKMFIPVLIVVALSIVTYGLWMTRGIGLPENAGLWNLAPFPLGIPVGLWLLYQGYKKSDVALAGVATFFLTPYMAVYSATSLMVIGASKYKREAVIVWVVSFVWVIYSARRLAIMFPDNVSF